jgi:hypothetical protein
MQCQGKRDDIRNGQHELPEGAVTITKQRVEARGSTRECPSTYSDDNSVLHFLDQGPRGWSKTNSSLPRAVSA